MSTVHDSLGNVIFFFFLKLSFFGISVFFILFLFCFPFLGTSQLQEILITSEFVLIWSKIENKNKKANCKKDILEMRSFQTALSN